MELREYGNSGTCDFGRMRIWENWEFGKIEFRKNEFSENSNSGKFDFGKMGIRVSGFGEMIFEKLRGNLHDYIKESLSVGFMPVVTALSLYTI